MNRDPSELGGMQPDRVRGFGKPASSGSGIGGSSELARPPLGGAAVPEGPYDSVAEHQREIERQRRGEGGFDIHKYSQQAQVKLREWRILAEDYARKDPAKALAAAVFGGFIVGRVLRMATSRKPRKGSRKHGRVELHYR